MTQSRDKFLIFGFIGALGVLGCLSFIVIAIAIGLLLQFLLGWDWTVAALGSFLAIMFIISTLDLFDFDKKKSTGPPCPHCGEQLRTPKAQQCFHCGEKWHGKSLERDDGE